MVHTVIDRQTSFVSARKKTAVHLDARSGGFCLQLAEHKAAGKDN